MATNAEFPPFEYLENDKVVGVDADIAAEIAKDLGVELEIVDGKFDAVIPSVQSGKVSFGAAGMTVTEEREKEVDFSVKYITSTQYIIVPKDSDVKTIEDLAGKKIGVQLGTTGDFIISDEIDGYKDDDGNPVKGVLQDTGATITYFKIRPRVATNSSIFCPRSASLAASWALLRAWVSATRISSTPSSLSRRITA